MSTLYVNTIKPQSGSVVAVSGTLDVSGTIRAYALETITRNDTTYLGSNLFGNNYTDTHQFTGSVHISGSSLDVTTAAGSAAQIILRADAGQDSTDKTTFSSADGGNLTITPGSGHLILAGTTPKLTVGDGAAEDTMVVFDGNAIDYYIALDDTDDKLHFGEGSTAGTTTAFTIDTNQQTQFKGAVSGSSTLHMVGAATFGNSLSVSGSATLGDASGDVTTVTGRLTGSQGAYFAKRVGIGTSTPGADLEINAEHPQILLKTSDSGGDSQIKFQASNSSVLANIRCDNTSNSLNHISFNAGTGEDHLVVDSTGKVGIGVTDPDSFLEVLGTSTQLKLSYDSDSYATITVASNSGTTIASGESGNITLDAAGDIILDAAGGDVLPASDNATNLGSASKRWANVFTGDLHLKNERGDWTILEESDYLCVVNNATGKKYKMMLQEIDD